MNKGSINTRTTSAREFNSWFIFDFLCANNRAHTHRTFWTQRKPYLNEMEPYAVQAEYSFQGENNDELRFQKGDIITVTQREDGGWWEGTLNDMTGWFPSNYVKEYKGEFA